MFSRKDSAVGRGLLLTFYYLLASRLPTQPVPGWRLGYFVRRMVVTKLAASCGHGVIVESNAYFGSGRTLRVGDNSQIGKNSRIGPEVTIGNDVVMGPDVVLMTTAHAFDDKNIPIRRQGALPIRPIVIEDDVWIGTRVIVLPGVRIGKGAVVGAGSVVSRDVPAYSVVAGVPARFIRARGDAPGDR